jgi:hypothetical protein
MGDDGLPGPFTVDEGQCRKGGEFIHSQGLGRPAAELARDLSGPSLERDLLRLQDHV